MATGHVCFPVLAITSSSPCLNWSVLLCKILIFIISCDILKSQGLRQISSLNRRNPENANRHAIASWRSAREPSLSASLTIASNISTVTGSFLAVGLARERCRPSSVAFTNGSTEGELKPAVVCAQDTALHASSTDALHFSLRCCRYREKSCSFAGIHSRPLEIAQIFHLLKARRYFVTVLFARLRKMVADNLLAKVCNSAHRSAFNFHGPSHL